jgi:small GTP-binding protein
MMHPAFKAALVGDSGVGKTAIFRRLQYGTFEANPASTVGGSFAQIMVPMGDGSQISVGLWDTAGQERFRSIAKAYFRNAVGVILAFDICERKTFDDVNMWLNDVHSLCDPTAVVLLVGNKCDLEPSRVVTLAEAEQYAQHHQLTYLETSALSGANVREAFVRVATQIYRKAPKGNKPEPVVKPQKKRGCCG